MLRLMTFFALLFLISICTAGETPSRPRAREAGVQVGVIAPGPLNAITDVAGVLVGQTTIIRGDNIRTGVTAILPHGGNLFHEKVPGAVFVGNAFGKLAGSTQVNELGEIETPILLTCTLCVPRVTEALIEYMLGLPGNEEVESINPLVGETNDGYLNDIRGRQITVRTCSLPLGMRKPAQSRRAASVRALARWPSGLRAASALHPAGFLRNSAATRLVCSCRRTSVGY